MYVYGSRLAAFSAGKPLLPFPFEYEAGPLGSDEVEVAVEYCGPGHSDISAIKNERYNLPILVFQVIR